MNGREQIAMEIEAFNGYIPNYPIMMNSSSDHGIYASYNYQFPSESLVWNSPETFVNQSDLSISSPTLTSTSFYYQSSNVNSTNSDENFVSLNVEENLKSKRGRKKGSKKTQDQPKENTRTKKRSESPVSPGVMKKRRLAANARERRRMNGLNVAFDR